MDTLPDDLVRYVFELTDKSTSSTSRLISKRFRKILRKREKSTFKGTSIVYQSALDGNYDLMVLNILYYGLPMDTAVAAGISGNKEVVNYFLLGFLYNKYDPIFQLFDGAIQGCNKDLVISCLNVDCQKRYIHVYNKGFDTFCTQCIPLMNEQEIKELISRSDFTESIDFVTVAMGKFGFNFISSFISSQSDVNGIVCRACCRLECYELLQYALYHGYSFPYIYRDDITNVDFGKKLFQDGYISVDMFFEALLRQSDPLILQYKNCLERDPEKIIPIIEKYDLEIVKEMSQVISIENLKINTYVMKRGKEFLRCFIELGMVYKKFVIRFKEGCWGDTSFEFSNPICIRHGHVFCGEDEIEEDVFDLPYMSPFDMLFLEKCKKYNLSGDYWMYLTVEKPNFEYVKFIIDNDLIGRYVSSDILFYMDGSKYYLDKNPEAFTEAHQKYNTPYEGLIKHYGKQYKNEKQSSDILDFFLHYVPCTHVLIQYVARYKSKRGFRVDLIRRYLREFKPYDETLNCLQRNYPFLLEERKNQTLLNIRCGDKVVKKFLKRKSDDSGQEANKKIRQQ